MTSMKTMMVVLMITLFGLLPIFQLAHAEVFKWVDEKGSVHLTEDPATIPEKYKDKARSRMTEEDSMTPEEKIRTKTKYEEEVRERLKREKKDYDAKELEKRVKEIMQITQKQRRGCEIINYSSYDVVSNVSGHISDGEGWISSSHNTCVDLVIQNNDRVSKTITEQNIIARTSSQVVTKWRKDMWGHRVPEEKKDKFNPKAFFLQIGPGETYRGSICFDRQLPIASLELQGL